MTHRIIDEYDIFFNKQIDEEHLVESLDSPITFDFVLNKHNRKMFDKILKGEFS